MHKFNILKLLAFSLSSLVISNAHAANSFDDAVKNATTTGHIRLGYIDMSPDVAGEKSTSAAAIGGHIKFETAEWNKLQLAIAPYFSEKIGFISGNEDSGELNGDFFDSNKVSFAYLGEAYVNYALQDGFVRYGRQLIETPFINTDDLRMLPHSFEGVWANFSTTKNLDIESGWVRRWAGFNTGGDQHEFKDAGEEGVFALGAKYTPSKAVDAQAWYYDVRKSFQILYADLIYSGINNLELGVQYGSYEEENASNVDGDFVGAMINYQIAPVTLTLSYNKASNDAGKSVSAGLGVGNFFTAMDDSIIADKTDAEAYRVGFDLAVNEDMNLGVFYGHFEDANKTNVDMDEYNLIYTYQVSKSLDLEYILASLENKALPNDVATNQTRNLLRVNYIF